VHQVSLLAVIVAGGVLIDTFGVRSILVPVVIHDIGRAAWWPWARRVARQDDVLRVGPGASRLSR
jgi:uncharacterized membrane protein YdfJ with MMPL/SSD domain